MPPLKDALLHCAACEQLSREWYLNAPSGMLRSMLHAGLPTGRRVGGGRQHRESALAFFPADPLLPSIYRLQAGIAWQAANSGTGVCRPCTS